MQKGVKSLQLKAVDIFLLFFCPLTSPPSRTSWSSVTIRTMLLGLLLGSAHLTRQVSSAGSSRSVTAAEAPLRRLLATPVPIVSAAIGPPQHHRAHTNTRGDKRTHTAVGLCLAPVEEKLTHAVHTRFEEVKSIIWSQRRRSDGSEHGVPFKFTQLLNNSFWKSANTLKPPTTHHDDMIWYDIWLCYVLILNFLDYENKLYFYYI